MKHKTDEELVKLANLKNDEAAGILIRRYVFEVRSCALRYIGGTVDFEDLVQEGFIGLLNAVSNYDSSLGASFKTFVKLCIDRNIISVVRAALRKKQIPKSSLVFLGEQDYPAADSINPENVVIAREEIDLLKSKIFSSLSEFEIKVLTLFLRGYTYEKIAETLNCKSKQVDNAMQRLRKKLK